MNQSGGRARVRAEESGDTAEAATIDASGTITPDPFLAEVARIPARSSLPAADALLAPGDAIGHFVIRSLLGRGGMGVVYAAEDVNLGRTVALKVLPLGDDDGRRKRFLREARAAAALTHPGIAIIYEIGEDHGRVFIAMELVPGKTLRVRLDGHALPIGDALLVACAIARPLARAHERGVVHRDLKPENVMIAEDGHIKLLDFGLAKPILPGDPEIGTATTATEHGRILGTPTYMSPEQAKGRAVDARSDVFSFGVMLYEMLTGRRPFAGASVVELFIALDRDDPIPPRRLNPRIPAAAERLILRCLRKDPADRYANAGALLRDLEVAVATKPSRASRLGLAAATVAAAAFTWFVAGHLPRADKAAPRIASIAVTDLPSPRTDKPEALAAYRAGLETFREGGPQVNGFARAVDLDPDFAAAHLQLAALPMGHVDEPTRVHFRKANAFRDRLDARDQALLDALEPLVQRQPADWAEANRRLAAAIARYPGDAELWHLHGLGRANYDDFEAAVADQKKAIELDPRFSHAYAVLALDLIYLGRLDEAQQFVDKCLAFAPTSPACLHQSAELRAEQGACEDLEGIARRMIAAGLLPQMSYGTLAKALAARGASTTSIREAFRQADEGLDSVPVSVLPENARKKRKISEQAALAFLVGDFEAALALKSEIAPIVEASKQQSDHASYARSLAEVYLEIGRDEDAGRVALDFLDRRDAWEPSPSAEDVAMAIDATPFLLRTALRAGAITRNDFDRRRDAWRKSWTARMTPVTKNFLWLHGYAATVDTEADARAALAALPQFSPLPAFRPDARVDADVGRTFLLAGRVDEAIAWLEPAARRCKDLWFPMEKVHTQLALGEAREAKGDKPGACAAYAAVITRWGHAKPRSVSADRARARRDALACTD